MLLYTVGKTGSTSFERGVIDACSWPGLTYLDRKQESYYRAIKVQDDHDVAVDFLNKIPANSTVWIVTLVRNPFDLMISMFTYNKWCDLLQHTGGDEEIWEKAIDDFDEYISSSKRDSHEFYESWANTVGVDALALPFDRTKKIGRFTTPDSTRQLTLKLLVLRTDDILQWDHIMAPIIPHFKTGSEKTGVSSMYQDLYSAFLKAMSFTEEQVRSMLNRRPEILFYSAEEIAEMLRKVPMVPDEANRTRDPSKASDFAQAVHSLGNSLEAIQECGF